MNSVEKKEEQIIPKKIFQTWHTKDLPPKMSENIEYIKKIHPDFEHYLFDSEDCRIFIKHYFDSSVINSELALVRNLDKKHSIIVTDSGEISTWYEASKAGDILGTTLYRTVRTPSGMIFTYDWLPPAFYKFRAWLWGKESSSFYISELQAEPWFGGSSPEEATISEMESTLSPNRLLKNINYAKHLGASRSYFWGVEWWYFMKTVKNDSRYLDIGKNIFQQIN